jgi:CelD/BcsL family acetyltransferase involved in cellulose biosynthesis
MAVVNEAAETSVEEIKLFYGEMADALLSDRVFVEQWERLYQACAWSTVFQGHDFFRIFHQIYEGKYSPMLVVVYVKGELKGLLPLSVNCADKRITGAGVNDAHYHAWICEEDFGNCFISRALDVVRNEFPKSPIKLAQLPPNIPLDWLSINDKWKGKYILQTETRPLVNLRDPSVFALPKKKDFKTNSNRLKKIGNLEVERVVDPEKFDKAVQVLMDQVDYRQAAKYGWLPFRDNPYRKKLYNQLFEAGFVYALMLKLDGQIIAGLTGTVGKDGWVHGAGVNCHSPLYNYYSPGFLCFIHLTQLLESQGFSYLDLSTGLLSYKKRIANEYDEVYELEIEPLEKLAEGENTLRAKVLKYKKMFSDKIWRLVESKENLPKDRDLIREKIKIYYKNHEYRKMWGFLKRGEPDENPVAHFYTGTAGKDSNKYEWEVNAIHHLLLYKPKALSLTLQEFLSATSQKFSEGQVCYTFSEGGELKWCIWEKKTEEENKEVHLEVFYCAPTFYRAVEEAISALTSKHQKLEDVKMTVYARTKESKNLRNIQLKK